MAGGHDQQVAHSHGFEVFGRLSRGIFGKEFQNLVVKAELTVSDSQPDGRRGEALAQRVHHMRCFGRLRLPPAFSHHMTVANDHHAVHGVDLFISRFHKTANHA